MTETAPHRDSIDLPKVHILPIGDVKESAKNPRKIPGRAVEIVAESIRRFGWKQPLVVDADHTLIVGHTRHRAARSLGLTNVPVIIASDLTPAEVDAYRIADNRASDFTTWDLPELTQQLAELEAEFADVLALADWDAVSADAERAGLGEVKLPPNVAHALDGGFQLNVCFYTKEEALAAEAAIIELAGVFDVRHDF
jgi:hypothetical protein